MRGAEFLRAFLAGTNSSEKIVAVDSRRVAIIEAELNGIVPDLGGGLCPRLGLVLGMNGRSWHATKRDGHFLLTTLIIASGAWTIVTKQWKVKVAFVPIGPGNIHSRTGLDVNFHGCRFSALVNRQWHE